MHAQACVQVCMQGEKSQYMHTHVCKERNLSACTCACANTHKRFASLSGQGLAQLPPRFHEAANPLLRPQALLATEPSPRTTQMS